MELDFLHSHRPLETSALYGKQGGLVWSIGLGHWKKPYTRTHFDVPWIEILFSRPSALGWALSLGNTSEKVLGQQGFLLQNYDANNPKYTAMVAQAASPTLTTQS